MLWRFMSRSLLIFTSLILFTKRKTNVIVRKPIDHRQSVWLQVNINNSHIIIKFTKKIRALNDSRNKDSEVLYNLPIFWQQNTIEFILRTNQILWISRYLRYWVLKKRFWIQNLTKTFNFFWINKFSNKK